MDSEKFDKIYDTTAVTEITLAEYRYLHRMDVTNRAEIESLAARLLEAEDHLDELTRETARLETLLAEETASVEALANEAARLTVDNDTLAAARDEAMAESLHFAAANARLRAALMERTGCSENEVMLVESGALETEPSEADDDTPDCEVTGIEGDMEEDSAQGPAGWWATALRAAGIALFAWLMVRRFPGTEDKQEESNDG